MKKYRERLKVIHAVQFLPGAELPPEVEVINDGEKCYARIKTLEGTMIAHPGDWITVGSRGVYPYKAGVFEANFEPVEELA